MQWWKMLGLAGFVGVAATGVVVARDQQQRRAYSPDEIRERLHERHAALAEAAEADATADLDADAATTADAEPTDGTGDPTRAPRRRWRR